MRRKTKIVLPTPDEFHCHLREGELLRWMVGLLGRFGWRGWVLVMPNLLKPILTAAAAKRYEREIRAHKPRFRPFMTIQITEKTTPEMIRQATASGISYGKIYARGVTTNSQYGVEDYDRLLPALKMAEECEMVVGFHGEHPSDEVYGLDKEREFLKILDPLSRQFSKLRIVLEHISTKEGINWVRGQERSLTAGTLTIHHALLTTDDVLGYGRATGGLMSVHNGCKPQPKRPEDRAAIVGAMLSGDSHFFYGGDPAPHLAHKKYRGACGNWNVPVALSKLIDLFSEAGEMGRLPLFLNGFGRKFYRLANTLGTITLEKRPWVVPEIYPVPGTNDGVVPFLASQTMNWQLVR